MLTAVPSAWAVTKTYTLDADFDLGTLLNVNHNTPNNDQLQLDSTTTPFPFVNIACSNRGTAVRIDVNTGTILGEFWTAPAGMGLNPSRTTVDQFAWDVEALLLARTLGFPIAEVPVLWFNSSGSRVALASGIGAYLDIFRIRRRVSRTMTNV